MAECGPPPYVEVHDEGMPMPHSADQITVTRDETQRRYEIHVSDVLAGFTSFRTDSRGRVHVRGTLMTVLEMKGLATTRTGPTAMRPIGRRATESRF